MIAGAAAKIGQLSSSILLEGYSDAVALSSRLDSMLGSWEQPARSGDDPRGGGSSAGGGCAASRCLDASKYGAPAAAPARHPQFAAPPDCHQCAFSLAYVCASSIPQIKSLHLRHGACQVQDAHGPHIFRRHSGKSPAAPCGVPSAQRSSLGQQEAFISNSSMAAAAGCSGSCFVDKWVPHNCHEHCGAWRRPRPARH